MLPQCLRDIDAPPQAQQPDSQIPHGRHGAGTRPSADLRAVFVKGNVAYPMQRVFDAPMAPYQFQQPPGAGLFRQTCDSIYRFFFALARFYVQPGPFDPKNLCRVREIEVISQGRAGLNFAGFDSPVPFVPLHKDRGKNPPGRGLGYSATVFLGCL